MKKSIYPARSNSKSFAGALFAVAFTLLAISAGADRSASEAASTRAPGRASSNPVAGDAQLALFGVLTPAAATINVNSTAEGPGGGACTLSAAIQAANTNLQVDGCAAGSSLGTDTIMLPAGRYILTTVNNNLDGVGATGLTAITSDVIIQGAGSATTIIERDPAATARFRLMAISNQSAGSLVLSDVTMRGGRASNDFPGLGGALFTRSRPATLNRVVFEDNTAPFGGAVYGPTFTVNDCTFTNNRATAGGGGAIGADAITVLRSFFTANTATRNGGAIEVGGGGVNSITDSSFSNNAATGASSSGGALLTGGTTTITGTSFTGNTANAESGAIAAGGTVNISDSVIRNNSANEIGAIGAGSFIGGASPLSLNIDRCDISNNAATGRSVGGVFALGGNVNISNSTISANTAIMDGGGIRAQNANLTLTNVTIDGNSTNGNGGGIWVDTSDEAKIVTLNSVTLTGNNAGGSGGGLHRLQGDTRFKNTIIARNISGSNSAPDIAGFFTSLGYNLVGIKDGASFTNTAGDRTGTAAAPINPLLGPLLANGGPTLTRALFGGSPAIDAGNPAVPGSGGDSCAAMDQRGTARPQDGDGNGSQICDIGAVENVFPPPTPQWQPVVLTAQQIAEIKAWTVGGRTYVYVKLQFPDAGYRIVSAGQFTRAGNDFTVDASVERFTGPSIQSIVTTALIYDLGPLTDGTYNFNFKTSGTLAKTLQFTVSSATPPPNPIDDARVFVKQQYRDFLNREADPAGENFWTDNITKCSDPARRPPGQTELQCTLRQRETTSGAFFLSPEFQFTGYYVYRMFQGGLGRQPKLSEFTPDAQFVGAGIIVNGQLSGAKIEQNKAAFAEHFVNCPDAAKARCAEFKAIYDGLNNQQYVDKLFQTTGVNASAADRAALVNGLNANPATETRASVLQKVVDGIVVISEGNQQFTTSYGQTFYNSEFNRAFVLLEYFGYMKRDPDDAGYAFWLDKLNQFAGNFVNAEMVLAFISSPEYRARFGAP